MKEKRIIKQGTKSLTTKKNESKDLLLKDEEKLPAEMKKTTKTMVSVNKTADKTKSKTKATVTKSKSSKSTKRTTKKVSAKSTATSKLNNQSELIAYANEYFDLPYRYNETVIKLLAQTPKRLFVYWDISDKDRENYIKTFGNDFFDKTIPFLRVKNETYNYIFDVDINDFANSWYININDDNSKYSIELYRRFKEPLSFKEIEKKNSEDIQLRENNTIFIVSSNNIDAPNGKVLFATYPRRIDYMNVKTNQMSYKIIDKPMDSKEFYNLFFKEEHYSTEKNVTTSR